MSDNEQVNEVLYYLWGLLDKEVIFESRKNATSEYGRYVYSQNIGKLLGGEMILTVDFDERNANQPDPTSSPENPDYSFLYETLTVDENAFKRVSKKGNLICTFKDMYQQVSNLLGNDIPWWFIGALHYRESHCNFNTVMHNGELLCDVEEHGTRMVPKGRGKGLNWSWIDSAVDAFKFMGYDKPTDWSISACLHRAERYNGLGYRNVVNELGVKEYSPYLFAYSNHHDESGKFVEDGKYDPLAPEYQVGVATIWKYLGVN